MTTDPSIKPRNRLWTPWRMTYVGEAVREPGCVFCNLLDGNDDVESLIVHRAPHSFVILNLYPYNTGHLMVVPNAHVQDPSELDPEAHGEMARLVGNVTGALRRALNCDGFNMGMNVGSAAGAGIAEHLHQHVVPRWIGDANFMPIVGSTKVLPELLAATYARVRAEIERDLHLSTEAKVLLLVGDGPGIAIDSAGLPVAPLERDTPVWRSVIGAVSDAFAGVDLLGWAGGAGTRNDDMSMPALALHASAVSAGATRFTVLHDVESTRLSTEDREIVQRGLARFRS